MLLYKWNGKYKRMQKDGVGIVCNVMQPKLISYKKYGYHGLWKTFKN